MIKVLPESHGNILGVMASEKLTDEDYKNIWVPQLEAIIKEYGKVRALLYVDASFKGWKLNALWDDTKFGLKHRNDIEKLVVVGGPKWSEWGTKLAGHFIKADVKTFPENQLQEAWDWIKS